MEDQAANSSDLLRMPVHIIEDILSNVLNLSNVSRTCKTLYEIVCDVEKRKRVVISIKPVNRTGSSARLTIDDDVVFASIMNSHRSITEIQLSSVSLRSPVKLNERQLERITAIMNRFGTSVTSLMLRRIDLSTNEIIELLTLTPKLETLKFANGTASGNATKSLHLPNFKTLEIRGFAGLLGFINSIPAGSLNYYSYYKMGNPELEMLKTVLTKQHNIKSLVIYFDFDPIDLSVNHLQLDSLDLQFHCKNHQLVEILKGHTNLKELRLSCQMHVCKRAFEWVCNNLRKLEVFKVRVNRYAEEKNVFVMLSELKNLRYLSTNLMDYKGDDEVQLEINSLLKLEIEDWHHDEDINEKMHSMARIFTNLTDLDMQLKDFSQLSIVARQCTNIIRLTSCIKQPDPQQLAGKYFPNIRQLSISTYAGFDFNIIVRIVRAMPNLKSLSMYGCTIFNVDMAKELIFNSLEDLHVNYFKLDLSTSEDFVNTVRCLSDNLKTYRLRFFSVNGNSFVRAITKLLSNEFKVRHDKSSGFDLYKGHLTKFYD